MRRRWCGTGGIVMHAKSGAAAAGLIEKRMFARLRSSVEKVHVLVVKKHGAAAAAALPDAANVRVAQLAGATCSTDNASAATCGSRHLQEAVRADVREQYGPVQFDALDEREQERISKVRGAPRGRLGCMRALHHSARCTLHGGSCGGHAAPCGSNTSTSCLRAARCMTRFIL